MLKNTIIISLSKDFQVFAEEQVREGKYSCIEEVARTAFQEMKFRTLYDELHEGLAELNYGHGEVSTLEDFMSEINAKAELTS